MCNRETIEKTLNDTIAYRDKLFAYGYIYGECCFNVSAYPFFGGWKQEKICVGGQETKNQLLVSSQLHYWIHEEDTYTMVLLGHAYNPFSGQEKEEEILETVSRRIKEKKNFFEYFNQLTGCFTLLFVDKENLYILGDATGIQTTYYGIINGKRYVSSHMRLLGDILHLDKAQYIEKLTSYKYYPLLGNALPGDLSAFEEVKRVIPNHYVKLTHNEVEIFRFFYPTTLSLQKTEIVDKVGNILKNSLQIIAKKWKKPAISLTGGCDSKTTLACAKDVYNEFNYFSYISSEEEKIDAEGAKFICEHLGLTHSIYHIPMEDGDLENIETHRDILFWNTGAMRCNNKNDVRKRAYFSQINDFDVEIKSWCSEVGRAYYSKRFNGRKKFGKMTPRKCTTMYKFFLHNRKLVRETDKVFKDYIATYFQQAVENAIPWQEQFFWEFRMSSWNGSVITGEHRYSFDITIPYNNRLLLQLLLSVPLEDRIEDAVYKAVREKMNSEIDKAGIAIQNLKHTKKRAMMENLYYAIHSKLPF